MLLNLTKAKKKDLNYFFILRKSHSNKSTFIIEQDLKYSDHKNWYLKSLKNEKNMIFFPKEKNKS